MRFLAIGDVTGRPGREAVSAALPKLRERFEPDSVIINIENIAHGAGISPDTIQEALSWEADCYTTGDHAWDNAAGVSILNDTKVPVIRPANYPPNVPGKGWHVWQQGAFQVAVINLQGQVFMRSQLESPFHKLDEILQQPEVKQATIKLVDFHAETTSEKRGLGWHADGKVSAVWGTHTHVPTADAQILPAGTGYITDLGMAGSLNSVIGVDKEAPLKRFLTQLPTKWSYDVGGPREIGAVVIDVDPSSGKTTAIEAVREIVGE